MKVSPIILKYSFRFLFSIYRMFSLILAGMISSTYTRSGSSAFPRISFSSTYSMEA